jgi:hypothetical protein
VLQVLLVLLVLLPLWVTLVGGQVHGHRRSWMHQATGSVPLLPQHAALGPAAQCLLQQLLYQRQQGAAAAGFWAGRACAPLCC